MARQLQLESLETRDLMAGDVTARVTNGNLVVLGDAAANTVEIRQLAGGKFQITGSDATTINGKASAKFNVTGDVSINMRGGNDVLQLGTNAAVTQVKGDINVHMGAGTDKLTLQRVRAANATLDQDSAGGGVLESLNVRRAVFTGTLDATCGTGKDGVVLTEVDADAIHVTTGPGAGSVELSTITANRLRIVGGAARDGYSARGIIIVRDDFFIDGGDGADWLSTVNTPTFNVDDPTPQILHIEDGDWNLS
jgi:hypothetical protein